MRKISISKPDSIKSQLSGIAVIFIIGTSLAMGCVGLWITQTFVKQRFHETFLVLSRYLARNAELGVLLKNREMLESLTLNLLQQKNILKVVIKDDEDKVIVTTAKQGHKNLSGTNTAPSMEGDEVTREGGGASFFSLDDKNGPSVSIVTPVHQIQPDTGDMVLYAEQLPNEVIGSVELYYATSDLKALTWTMTRFFIFIALLLSLLSVIWYWYFARTITAPLMDLVALSRRVSKGDFDIRAKGGNLQETRTLARGFNEMLDAIKAHQNEMEGVHVEMSKQRSLAEIGKFSMMVAHELKNPVAIIKGSMDIFKKEGIDEATKKDMILYVDDEILRLTRLIDEFLLFAKPKKPMFSEVSMAAFINDVVEKFRFTVSGKKIRVTCLCEDVTMPCDMVLMERAILNILKNSVENTKTEDVEIRVRGEDQRQHYLVHLMDRGPGIDPEVLEDIFNPFFTTRAKGTGLGLAIVRDIVAVHHGTVMVENRPDGGACFTVKLEKTETPSYLSTRA